MKPGHFAPIKCLGFSSEPPPKPLILPPLTIQVAAPLYKSFEIDDSVWPPRFTKLEIVLSGDVRRPYVT